MQLVSTAPVNGTEITLSNLSLSGGSLTADLSVPSSGTYVLERSFNLMDPWTPIGTEMDLPAGVTQVEDPDAPVGGRAFYRVRRQ